MSRQFRVEQVVDQKQPDGWADWPATQKRLSEWAIKRELDKNGGRVVADESICTTQADLPGQFVLSRTVTIEGA